MATPLHSCQVDKSLAIAASEEGIRFGWNDHNVSLYLHVGFSARENANIVLVFKRPVAAAIEANVPKCSVSSIELRRVMKGSKEHVAARSRTPATPQWKNGRLAWSATSFLIGWIMELISES